MKRFLALFRKGQLNRDLEDEIRFHLESQVEQNLRQGMTPEQARREAHLQFGGVEQVKEAYRDRRGIPLFEIFFQDLRYSLRVMGQSRAFTAVAILTLALGIGAASAIFSVVNAVLLKPLPFREADRLVLVRMQIPKFGAAEQLLPAPDTVEYRKSEVFEEAATWLIWNYDLSGDGGPEQVTGARISANLIPMLGVTPIKGRAISEDEDRLRSHVVLLSYSLWQSRYAGNPRIVGSSILLNRQPYEVIGVMPAKFVFPPRGLPQEPSAALWIPLSLTPGELSTYLEPLFSVLGRLRPGVSLARANADMLSIAHRIQASLPPLFKSILPPGFEIRGIAVPFRERVVGGSRELLFLLLGAVVFLLLIACANVANMLLSRGATRGRELALRAALGAGRARLIRQLLTESTILSTLGGALGMLLARAGVGLLIAALPADLPLTEQVQVDSRVLAFAFVVSVLTGLLFGLAPAFVSTRTGLGHSMKEGARSAHQGWLLSGLVSVQLALALVLLTGAGLLIRSFVRLATEDHGFRTEHLLTAAITLPESQYREQSAHDFYGKLYPQLASLPGSLAAGLSSDLPFEGLWSRIVTPEGSSSPSVPNINFTLVLGDFLQALHAPLKRGRFFTGADRRDMHPVLIVNETLARRFWPGEDPIGKRMKWGTPQMSTPWMTVVGMVGDINQGAPDKALWPHAYGPFAQWGGGGWVRKLNLAMRTTGDPLALSNAVRAEVARLDPELPVTKVRTMDEILAGSLSPRRLRMWLLTVFALAALLLAALGIYGVMAYAVARRTREIGIRMALGAQRATVLRMVLGQGMKLVIIGVAIGLGASLALSRLMTSLLYEVNATDPVTYTSVALLLISIALAAHAVPARRAVKVDPSVALRHE